MVRLSDIRLAGRLIIDADTHQLHLQFVHGDDTFIDQHLIVLMQIQGNKMDCLHFNIKKRKIG